MKWINITKKVYEEEHALDNIIEIVKLGCLVVLEYHRISMICPKRFHAPTIEFNHIGH